MGGSCGSVSSIETVTGCQKYPAALPKPFIASLQGLNSNRSRSPTRAGLEKGDRLLFYPPYNSNRSPFLNHQGGPINIAALKKGDRLTSISATPPPSCSSHSLLCFLLLSLFLFAFFYFFLLFFFLRNQGSVSLLSLCCLSRRPQRLGLAASVVWRFEV